MKKLFSPLALAFALVSTLTGCELYFGGNSGGGDDRWTYCANDGYYVCNGDNCEWAGARCPDEPGYTCESDSECAAGCYCSTAGVCEEAGFCSRDTDCPEGYTCDEDRASCVPEACAADTDCAAGEYCDPNGACTPSCLCTSDQQAQDLGYGFCDEARGTCEPTPDTGSCVGTSTCTTAEPTCAVGEVALIKDGCYTGACSAIGACDIAPGCEALQHEADCLGANMTCTSVYYGINCTNNQGTACQPGMGDTSCVCQSFSFAECRTRLNAMMVYPTSDGSFVDVFAH